MTTLSSLSILVTVFNKIEYLESLFGCLRVAVNSGAQVIIIDDNSSDGSSEFLKNQAHLSGIELISMSKNMGSAISRNTAISKATKQFFVFCDADDEINLKALSEALAKAIKSDADINKFPYIKRGPDKEFMIPSRITNCVSEVKSYAKDDLLSKLGYWRYIYKTEKIKNNYFFYPELHELDSKYFILDDFFWLLTLIASDELTKFIHSEPIFYVYNLPPSTIQHRNSFRKQIMYLPQALPIALQKVNMREDYDFNWFNEKLILYYANQMSKLRILDSLRFIYKLITIASNRDVPINFLYKLLKRYLFTASLKNISNSIKHRRNL